MIQPLTIEQIQQLQTQLAAGQISEVYSTLLDRGYTYAGWANGVANTNTIAGIAAVEYLNGTALMGLGSQQCQNLSAETMQAIKQGMAEEYLRTLTIIAEKSPTNTADRDINATEVWAFHKKVFLDNGLGIENWTLDAVFRVLQRMGGDQAVEVYWATMSATGGSGPLAMFANANTFFLMLGAALQSGDPESRELAEQWLENVPGFADRGQWARSYEVVSKFVSSSWRETDRSIAGLVCATFFSACAAPAADPLTLDLDGDGIETVGINTSNPILFDITATGIQQSVGWVGADDGFLVRDLNGNGLIDSGAELFGDATQLAGGQTAADGFAALADLDANQDGVVNAADAAFASLRVWRDLDQDGVTDAGELLTLAALGITGLNVASTSHSQTLANGNQIADLGTYIKADGQVGTLGQTADVNLAIDTFTSQFTDTLPVSEAVNDIHWEMAA